MMFENARQFARRIATIPAAVPGYASTWRKLKSQALSIVMYHGVTERHLDVPNWSQLHVDEFGRQIEFLARHYRLLTLGDAIEALREGRPLPPRSACITFDDGFRNVATTAFPILQKYNAPATVFLITGLVGTNRAPWPEQLYQEIVDTRLKRIMFEGTEFSLDGPGQRENSYVSIVERLKKKPLADRQRCLAELTDALGATEIAQDASVSLMDWDEIEKLAGSGLMTFGSHSHTHPILSRCPVEVQRMELETSRNVLRERGLSADLFAYPNGTAADFTDDTKRILIDLGYRCGVATTVGLNEADADLYALKRVNVSNRTKGRKFELRMVGL
jgi:peptidoglycan/xylan/chitin deacetylase (PgdA/CDA1 family)